MSHKDHFVAERRSWNRRRAALEARSPGGAPPVPLSRRRVSCKDHLVISSLHSSESNGYHAEALPERLFAAGAPKRVRTLALSGNALATLPDAIGEVRRVVHVQRSLL